MDPPYKKVYYKLMSYTEGQWPLEHIEYGLTKDTHTYLALMRSYMQYLLWVYLIIICDVIMGAMVSQITGITIVYLTICSGADQRKTSKFRITGLCVGNSPVTGEFTAQKASNPECFHLMMSSCGVVATVDWQNICFGNTF